MNKLRILVVMMFVTRITFAQNFSLELSDNNGVMEQKNVFKVTQDSLSIVARSDYGRSIVNYLNRSLTPDEKIGMSKYLKAFPLDSIQKLYFNEYNNFQFIDADHAPRAFELKIVVGDSTYESAATNAYVYLYARLITQLNTMLPAEVKINYDINKFKAFY
ncbi:hypothetical protein BH11BAC2_BH11BAC2_10000 [soil metagenome]